MLLVLLAGHCAFRRYALDVEVVPSWLKEYGLKSTADVYFAAFVEDFLLGICVQNLADIKVAAAILQGVGNLDLHCHGCFCRYRCAFLPLFPVKKTALVNLLAADDA